MSYAKYISVRSITIFLSVVFCLNLQGASSEWGLTLLKSYKASDRAKFRPVCWDSLGRCIFSGWGESGSDLAVFDVHNSEPRTFPADDYTISGIAYKNNGASGLATTSIDPLASGKSRVRLWDSETGTSQLLSYPNFNLEHGIISLEGDAYAILQMGQKANLIPPGILHYVTPYSHEQTPIPQIISTDIAPLPSEKACVVGAFTLNSTVNGILYDIPDMNRLRELHSHKDNFITTNIRTIDDTVFAFGWHVVQHSSGQVCYPSVSQWSANQTIATRDDLTMFTKMHNMPISFDVNSRFIAGGLENGTVFISDVSAVSKPIIQLKNVFGNPALSIAWNPAQPNQCAIGTCDGVYVFQVTPPALQQKAQQFSASESAALTSNATYTLSRTAQYTYDTITTPRPLCWANETLLLTAQGKTGSQLAGIMCMNDADSESWPQLESVTTGDLPITGIATKDTTVDGIMTTACDWFNGGKSEVRLWNRTSFASRVIYSDAQYLNGGVVSGEGNRWIVVRKTENPGKGAGSLYTFAGDTLQWVAKNGAPFMVSGSRFSGARELAIGLWDFTSKKVGCFFDPHAKGIYGTLYAPDENTWITELKVAAHSVYGFGASDSLCFFHWGYGKNMAIKYPLPFCNAAPQCFDLSEDYVVGACESLETVTEYGDTAYRSTVFVCSTKKLDEPLCKVVLNERVSTLAWNPTRKNQFAVASDKGVSLYSFSESQKENQSAQDLRQIYRQLFAY